MPLPHAEHTHRFMPIYTPVSSDPQQLGAVRSMLSDELRERDDASIWVVDIPALEPSGTGGGQASPDEPLSLLAELSDWILNETEIEASEVESGLVVFLRRRTSKGEKSPQYLQFFEILLRNYELGRSLSTTAPAGTPLTEDPHLSRALQQLATDQTFQGRQFPKEEKVPPAPPFHQRIHALRSDLKKLRDLAITEHQGLDEKLSQLPLADFLTAMATVYLYGRIDPLTARTAAQFLRARVPKLEWESQGSYALRPSIRELEREIGANRPSEPVHVGARGDGASSTADLAETVIQRRQDLRRYHILRDLSEWAESGASYWARRKPLRALFIDGDLAAECPSTDVFETGSPEHRSQLLAQRLNRIYTHLDLSNPSLGFPDASHTTLLHYLEAKSPSKSGPVPDLLGELYRMLEAQEYRSKLLGTETPSGYRLQSRDIRTHTCLSDDERLSDSEVSSSVTEDYLIDFLGAFDVIYLDVESETRHYGTGLVHRLSSFFERATRRTFQGEKFREKAPRLIVVTRDNDAAQLHRCLNLGASAYVLKDRLYKLPGLTMQVRVWDTPAEPKGRRANFRSLYRINPREIASLQSVDAHRLIRPRSSTGSSSTGSSSAGDDRWADWIRRLPKADLHYHIGTSISLPIISAAALNTSGYLLDLPAPENVEDELHRDIDSDHLEQLVLTICQVVVLTACLIGTTRPENHDDYGLYLQVAAACVLDAQGTPIDPASLRETNGLYDTIVEWLTPDDQQFHTFEVASLLAAVIYLLGGATSNSGSVVPGTFFSEEGRSPLDGLSPLSSSFAMEGIKSPPDAFWDKWDSLLQARDNMERVLGHRITSRREEAQAQWSYFKELQGWLLDIREDEAELESKVRSKRATGRPGNGSRSGTSASLDQTALDGNRDLQRVFTQVERVCLHIQEHWHRGLSHAEVQHGFPVNGASTSTSLLWESWHERIALRTQQIALYLEEKILRAPLLLVSANRNGKPGRTVASSQDAHSRPVDLKRVETFLKASKLSHGDSKTVLRKLQQILSPDDSPSFFPDAADPDADREYEQYEYNVARRYGQYNQGLQAMRLIQAATAPSLEAFVQIPALDTGSSQRTLLRYLRGADLLGSEHLQYPENLILSAYDLVDQAAEDNVWYSEVRCSTTGYQKGGMSAMNATNLLCASLTLASLYVAVRGEPVGLDASGNTVRKQQPWVRINILLGAKRHKTQKEFEETVRLLTHYLENGGPEYLHRNLHRKGGIYAVAPPWWERCRIAGFDLSGNEQSNDLEFGTLMEPLFHYSAPITIHAGEAATAQRIWEAVYRLSARRIGHGLRIRENARLLGYCIREGIGMEMCPISNHYTNGFEEVGSRSQYDGRSRRTHFPLLFYRDEGLDVCINTDNRQLHAGKHLTDEYLHAARLVGGFSEWELLHIVKCGFKHAFLPKEEIEMLLDGVEEEILSIVVPPPHPEPPVGP